MVVVHFNNVIPYLRECRLYYKGTVSVGAFVIAGFRNRCRIRSNWAFQMLQ